MRNTEYRAGVISHCGLYFCSSLVLLIICLGCAYEHKLLFTESLDQELEVRYYGNRYYDFSVPIHIEIDCEESLLTSRSIFYASPEVLEGADLGIVWTNVENVFFFYQHDEKSALLAIYDSTAHFLYPGLESENYSLNFLRAQDLLRTFKTNVQTNAFLVH